MSFGIGPGLSLAPIGAYLAVKEGLMLPVLFLCSIFWVSGFDIIYALQDIEFDQSQNYIPFLGAGKTKACGFNIACYLCWLLTCGVYGCFIGYIGWVVIFVGMLFYQHTIVKPNDLRK